MPRQPGSGVACRRRAGVNYQQTGPYAADSTTVWGLDDREIVVAIVAGDPTGLAGAYDKYAESLYGYCRWMLSEPADAADAVQDTFVIAAAKLGGLRDPRKLRPWLYAVARNACHRRLPANEIGLDEAADGADVTDVTDGAADVG